METYKQVWPWTPDPESLVRFECPDCGNVYDAHTRATHRDGSAATCIVNCPKCGERKKAGPLSVGLTKLSLRPGDVLVVTVPDHVTYGDMDRIHMEVADLLPPDVRPMVLSEGMKLTLLRPWHGEPVAPEVEPAVVVEVPK